MNLYSVDFHITDPDETDNHIVSEFIGAKDPKEAAKFFKTMASNWWDDNMRRVDGNVWEGDSGRQVEIENFRVVSQIVVNTVDGRSAHFSVTLVDDPK